jgi:hypothetical protein
VVAAQKLLVILQYDFTKLSVMYKPSKHHGVDTQQFIKGLTTLEKTNWIILQIAPEYRKWTREYEEFLTKRPVSQGRSVWIDNISSKVIEAYLPERLHVYRYIDNVMHFNSWVAREIYYNL